MFNSLAASQVAEWLGHRTLVPNIPRSIPTSLLTGCYMQGSFPQTVNDTLGLVADLVDSTPSTSGLWRRLGELVQR